MCQEILKILSFYQLKIPSLLNQILQLRKLPELLLQVNVLLITCCHWCTNRQHKSALLETEMYTNLFLLQFQVPRFRSCQAKVRQQPLAEMDCTILHKQLFYDEKLLRNLYNTIRKINSYDPLEQC